LDPPLAAAAISGTGSAEPSLRIRSIIGGASGCYSWKGASKTIAKTKF